MRCAFCGDPETRVVDTRVTEDGMQVRRRRECPQCNARFSTFETVELKLPLIIKRDGRREPFAEAKLRGGIERAFEKRNVGLAQIDEIIEQVIRKLRTAGERELPASQLGAWVMQALKDVDQVAYVRFASVYRQFKDLDEFMHELRHVIGGGKPGAPDSSPDRS